MNNPLLTFASIALLACASAFAEQPDDVHHTDNDASSGSGWFSSNTIYVKSTTNNPVFNAEISGSLEFPSEQGVHPAIILMHGCGGNTDFPEEHASMFRKHGYATLVLDSFSARDGNICRSQNDLGQARYYRPYDAYHALTALQKNPRIDAKNVSVLGYSNGGHAAFSAANGLPVFSEDHFPDKSLRFASAIALFSWCGHILHELVTPVLFLGGGRDTWVPPDQCLSWYRNGVMKGAEYKAVVYPDAYHGFIRGQGTNTVWNQHGKAITVGGTYEQAEQANRAILEFLAKHRK